MFQASRNRCRLSLGSCPPAQPERNPLHTTQPLGCGVVEVSWGYHDMYPSDQCGDQGLVHLMKGLNANVKNETPNTPIQVVMSNDSLGTSTRPCRSSLVAVEKHCSLENVGQMTTPIIRASNVLTVSCRCCTFLSFGDRCDKIPPRT